MTNFVYNADISTKNTNLCNRGHSTLHLVDCPAECPVFFLLNDLLRSVCVLIRSCHIYFALLCCVV